MSIDGSSVQKHVYSIQMCFGKLIAVRLDKSLYGLILNWIYAKRKTRPLGAETIFPNYLTATPRINHVKVVLLELKEKKKIEKKGGQTNM